MFRKIKKVILIFIFTNTQINRNKYKSDNAVQFMIESLKDLDHEINKIQKNLQIYYGKEDVIVDKIIEDNEIDAIFTNMDYTPYAVKRDKKLEQVCQKNKLQLHLIEDYLLHPIGTLLKEDGEPYRVYTHF